MKKVLFLMLFLALEVMATQSPFSPALVGALNSGVLKLTKRSLLIGSSIGRAGEEAESSDGSMSKRFARATYDATVDGGTLGDKGLGVKLPANALIVDTYVFTPTAFVSAGGGQLFFYCEDNNPPNLVATTTATSFTVATTTDGFQDFSNRGSYTTGIASECEITVNVSSSTVSVGKAVIFVEYQTTE